jgi:hypothetical protein
MIAGKITISKPIGLMVAEATRATPAP